MENIKDLIFNIREMQVLLDNDVAKLYKYETKYIVRAMKRNIGRFPENFCFQLTKEEYDFLIKNNLRCQVGTSNLKEKHGGRRYLPYVFTEQGIAMLSGLLKNEVAVQVSINIMNAFVEMRKFISLNSNIFERLINVEHKLLENDKKFNILFDALSQEKEFKHKIFYNGQIYDAYSLILKIIKKATKNIIIIDNYIDDAILDFLVKKNKNVNIKIITSRNSKLIEFDIIKFNEQYKGLFLYYSDLFHDRFIILDEKIIYHIGASLKDLGKKCFAINIIEDNTLLEKLTSEVYNK